MSGSDIIGIVGGMGPAAGVDLFEKIVRATTARSDHEHLPVVLMSYPAMIPDRSPFLMGSGGVNPASAIHRILLDLEAAGATVAGIPCNTAHAPAILDVVRAKLIEGGSNLQLVSMIDVTVNHLKESVTPGRRVGVLSTAAVRKLRIYAGPLAAAGFEVIHPDPGDQDQLVTTAIFSRSYGLKAVNPATAQARANLLDAIEHLTARGADAVILGCTELPLAVPEGRCGGIPLLDPTILLARELVRSTYPELLAP